MNGANVINLQLYFTKKMAQLPIMYHNVSQNELVMVLPFLFKN
jgi:hypothetical protein